MTLSEAVEILRAAGVENPRYDARIIFSKIGKIGMEKLILGGEVEDGSEAALAIMKRAERIPLEYVMGSVDFYRENYIVDEGCLIPRDDTERLVEFAVKNIPDGAHFLDLCTGSGCVALSTLANTQNTTALAVDISDAALDVAKTNAQRLSLCDRVEFLRADVLDKPICDECFAVLSNPPYVTDAEYGGLSEEIKKEPKIAFVGGVSGLDFYRKITELYKSVISPGGFIAFEIGYRQATEIREIASANEMTCEIIKDLSGNDRVAVLRATVKAD